MQFTEQLFINLVLPHIEILDLLNMRRISSAIKAIADRRLFAHIKNEVNEIKAITCGDYYDIYLQRFACDNAWYPAKISDHSVLLHFIVRCGFDESTYRYNMITGRLQILYGCIPLEKWPDSGFIPAGFMMVHKSISLVDMFDIHDFPKI